MPICNVLEKSCHVVVANPKYVRAIRRKKTDDKDATWIADLFKFGLVPQSFIPQKELFQKRKEQYIKNAIKLLKKGGCVIIPPSVPA
ncbi:MAG: hypothetical protein VB114_20480 [Lutispora sp.]|nr:hypothetical protein [Lutispora sp.]MEA4964029.1 hypothetical protein [Lutispora sp.]